MKFEFEIVTSFVFFQKQNVRAFIIVLGVTMKAVGFESYPEVNGFIKKFVMKDKCLNDVGMKLINIQTSRSNSTWFGTL